MQINRGKWVSTIIFIAILGISALTSAAADKDSEKIAVVNGTIITKDVFNREMDRIRQRFSQSGRPLDGNQLSSMKEKVLESVIGAELLYQEGRKQGIKIDEKMINEQWEALKRQFSNETEFRNALIKMNSSETLVKSQIERGLIIQQFINNEFITRTKVSEKEMKDFYDNNPDRFRQPEQIKASHILIKVDPKADEAGKKESRKEIEKIKKRLKKGEDFAELARKFSQGPSSVDGGDLGYFSRGKMVKAFEEAAFSLKTGEVSDVVETQFGYHLIKIADRKEETTIGYQEVKEKLQEVLKQTKVNKEIGEYINKLRERAKVEIFL